MLRLIEKIKSQVYYTLRTEKHLYVYSLRKVHKNILYIFNPFKKRAITIKEFVKNLNIINEGLNNILKKLKTEEKNYHRKSLQIEIKKSRKDFNILKTSTTLDFLTSKEIKHNLFYWAEDFQT